MFNFITLHCHYCGSVMMDMPQSEVEKMDGLSFECECCGHINLLAGGRFTGKDGVGNCPEAPGTTSIYLLDPAFRHF